MTGRRAFLLAFGAGTLAATLPSFAVQPARLWRIGFLAPRARPGSLETDYYGAFVSSMRELGYVEGKSFVVEWRFADGKLERLPGLVADLVRAKVDVIVSVGTPATHAAQQAAPGVSIVHTGVADPVGSGFAASLARPGGNLTGPSANTADMGPKQLGLLKTMMPGLSRVAVLVNSASSSHGTYLKNARAGTQKAGIKLVPIDARTAQEIERGFALIAKERADALIVTSDPLFFQQRQQISELAARHRLASIFGFREYAQAGGLISYGHSVAENYRSAAAYVDKILRGAKPGRLPIEPPAKLELFINLATAKALGLAIPRDLLRRADGLIE